MARIRLRQARLEDGRKLWRWRNEIEVRRQSFHSQKISWTTHRQWFSEKLADPATKILMAREIGGADAGHARLNRVKKGLAEVHIVIASRARGRGLGTETLAAACRYAVKHMAVKRVQAHILAANRASEIIFEKNGFKKIRTLKLAGKKASFWILQVK